MHTLFELQMVWRPPCLFMALYMLPLLLSAFGCLSHLPTMLIAYILTAVQHNLTGTYIPLTDPLLRLPADEAHAMDTHYSSFSMFNSSQCSLQEHVSNDKVDLHDYIQGLYLMSSMRVHVYRYFTGDLSPKNHTLSLPPS